MKKQKSYVYAWSEGDFSEYRRHQGYPTVLLLESRVLDRDGRPYDDRWYPVSVAELLDLQERGSDIVAKLAQE